MFSPNSIDRSSSIMGDDGPVDKNTIDIIKK